MMRIETLFWAALIIAVLSFVLFAWQVIAQLRHRKTTTQPVSGLGDAEQRSLDITKTLNTTGELAASLAKAGPIATTAAIHLVSLFVALLASGLVKIEG